MHAESVLLLHGDLFILLLLLVIHSLCVGLREGIALHLIHARSSLSVHHLVLHGHVVRIDLLLVIF